MHLANFRNLLWGVLEIVIKVEKNVTVMATSNKPQKLAYRFVGKYYEFVMNDEVKERSSDMTTLMQKVKKYKLGVEPITKGIEKFL